jgi:lipopolysaccharide export system permease protein
MEGGQVRYLIYAQRTEPNQLHQVVMQIYTAGQLEGILRAEKAIWKAGLWEFMTGKLLEWPHVAQTRVMTFSRLSYALQHQLPEIVNQSKVPMEMNLRELSQHIEALQAGGQPFYPLAVRMHQKLSLPMTTCLFVLLGATLGARTLSSKMQGFGLSLFVVFIYYLLFSIGTALGDTGTLAPWLAAWGANFVLIGVLVGLIKCQP